jgi:hypothetical protein
MERAETLAARRSVNGAEGNMLACPDKYSLQRFGTQESPSTPASMRNPQRAAISPCVLSEC